jgi:hypothetical protein
MLSRSEIMHAWYVDIGGFARNWTKPAIVSDKPVTTWVSKDMSNTFWASSWQRGIQERTDLETVLELEIFDTQFHCSGTLTIHQPKTATMRRNACPTMPTMTW